MNLISIPTCNKSVEESILYIENIEKINSRGVLLDRYQPKYVILFICLYDQASHHVKTNERELNSSSSIEGSL
ncbi:hypothetical protein SFRURICE_014942 [Spodoptera frugiperda]|nr:hypothetical protein SFRURICE_014942 [Spodoptera frugiperda]